MSIVLRLRKPWYTESSRVLPGNLAAMSPVAPSGTSPGLYMPFLPSTSDHTFLFAFCHPEIELSNLFPFVFLCGYFIVASWRRGGKCPCSAAILNLKLYHSCLVFIYFFLGIFFFYSEDSSLCHLLSSGFPECFKIICLGHLCNVLDRVALTKSPKHYNLIKMGV